MDLSDEENMLMELPVQTETLQTVIHNAMDQSGLIQKSQTKKIDKQKDQSLCKLNKIDCAASIKNEVQQLVRSKVSEEINSKVFNDMKLRAREHISDLQLQNQSLHSRIQALNKVVADDEKILGQFESVLLQTNEVIGFLKTAMDKLSLKYQECCKNDLSDKALQQKEELWHLNYSKSTSLQTEKEKLQNVETSCQERVEIFKCDFLQKQDFLKNLIEKYEEFKKVVAAVEEAIAKSRLKKQNLEQKLLPFANRSSDENSSLKQSDELKQVNLALQQLEEKFQSLSDKKCSVEQDFQQLEPELKDLQDSLSFKDEQIAEEEKKLNNLQDELKNIRDQGQSSLKVKIQQYDESCNQICELMESFAQYFFKNNPLFHETSNTSFFHMSQKSLLTLKKYLERQRIIYKFQLNPERNQSETCEQLLQSLKEDAVVEKDQFLKELTELKLKVEVLEKEQESCLVEAEMKKEYLLANATFLEQKQNKLAQETLEYEKNNEKLLIENLALMESINLKKQQLKEYKCKLNIVAPASNLKPPKSPGSEKKVTFSDFLSFKSPTSSELSNSGPADLNDLNTSNFSTKRWLEDNISQKGVETISDEDF